MKVTITEKAKKEILNIIKEQSTSPDKEIAVEDKVYLRLRVLGGGCSGFQHKLDLTNDFNEKLDNTMVVDGVDVVVDKRSALYLDGVIVDFHDDINTRGFSIKNPSAKGTCGCGSSFSM